MRENRRAFIILQMMVLTAVVIFFIERNFLVAEARGATMSHYGAFRDADKVLLLIEDFEGLLPPGEETAADTTLSKAGFFSFGSCRIGIDQEQVDKNVLASESALRISWSGTEAYGGWGKGVGANINLDPETDFVNFRIFNPVSNGNDRIKVIMEEDDNDNGKLEPEADDKWSASIQVSAKDEWQLISIPLSSFNDENAGGDHVFNISRKGGLHNIIFTFEDPARYTKDHTWYFDFICFTAGKLTDSHALK